MTRKIVNGWLELSGSLNLEKLEMGITLKNLYNVPLRVVSEINLENSKIDFTFKKLRENNLM